jgi:hypothetical protein
MYELKGRRLPETGEVKEVEEIFEKRRLSKPAFLF